MSAPGSVVRLWIAPAATVMQRRVSAVRLTSLTPFDGVRFSSTLAAPPGPRGAGVPPVSVKLRKPPDLVAQRTQELARSRGKNPSREEISTALRVDGGWKMLRLDRAMIDHLSRMGDLQASDAVVLLSGGMTTRHELSLTHRKVTSGNIEAQAIDGTNDALHDVAWAHCMPHELDPPHGGSLLRAGSPEFVCTQMASKAQRSILIFNLCLLREPTTEEQGLLAQLEQSSGGKIYPRQQWETALRETGPVTMESEPINLEIVQLQCAVADYQSQPASGAAPVSSVNTAAITYHLGASGLLGSFYGVAHKPAQSV